MLIGMDLTGSMVQLIFERFNITLARSIQTIQAVNLKGRIASYLKVPKHGGVVNGKRDL